MNRQIPPLAAAAHDIYIRSVVEQPRGEIIALVSVDDIECGVRFVRDGRATPLVEIADEDLKARIRAAVLAHDGGRA